MKLKLSEPGVAISLLAHGSLLALLILNIPWLADKPADDNMPEAVPIETISQSDFNQIMKGEKSSKDVTKEPVTKVDKVAQAEEQHAEPPKPDVQKEAPPPPPPKPAAPTPPVPVPPTPAPPPPPPPPEPPQRPDPTPPPPLPPEVPTPPVPTPAPKPAPAKPAPPAPVPPERDPDAEVIKPAPPPKPVPTPPQPPKHVEAKPKPVPTPPQPPKVAEVKPPPKRPVDKPDPMAKLVDETADTQPDPKPAPAKPVHKAAHAKPAAAPRETAAAEGTAEPTDQKAFDPTDISRILNAQPAGAPPSTGRQLSKTASRGATSGNAPKMSPTQSDALDGLLADQFKQCWSYLGLDHGRYIPEIKVSYAEDGSLQNEPTLLNRPSDPAARSLAESALRAVRQCNPLHIPAQFAPFYDQWRSRILRFDPAEMAG